ncbi:MAG: HigA family addiction module antitoxin [Phormidesmis sp.]
MSDIYAMHPGQILLHGPMDDFELDVLATASALGISASVLDELIKGHRAIDAELAARLGRVFESTPEQWLEMQFNHDLQRAQEAMNDPEIAALKPAMAIAA